MYVAQPLGDVQGGLTIAEVWFSFLPGEQMKYGTDVLHAIRS